MARAGGAAEGASEGDGAGGWLPTTAYAILGLLSFGEEFTGYEVRRRALASLRYFFWSPAMSQVYTELRRLKGLGLVSERASAKNSKGVFAITPQGTAELARWVTDGPAEWSVLKHLTCLRIFYGHLVEPAQLRARVEAHRDWALQMREELAAIPPRMPADPRWEYAKLVVEWGLEYYGEEAESAERLAKKLRRFSAGTKKPAKAASSASPAKRRRP